VSLDPWLGAGPPVTLARAPLPELVR